MLVDQIKKAVLLHSQPQAMHELLENILASDKFELNNGVLDTLYDISNYSLEFFIKSMQFVLIPGKKVWFEFDFSYRENIITTNRQIPDNAPVGTFRPTRLGYLLESNEDLSITEVVIVWMYKENICFSTYGFTIDLRNRDWKPTPFEKQELLEQSKNQFPKDIKEQKILDILVLENFFKMNTIHKYSREVFDKAIKSNKSEVLQMLHESGVYDTKGEWRYVIALLIFLSAVKGHDIVESPPSKKIEKYKIIKLNKDLVGDMPLVRFHYKVRKTGIFAWRPHFRATRKPSSMKTIS